jgi:hypothetical protein
MHLAAPHHTQVHERICPVKPSYEPGMKVTYDDTSQRVVVAFRGRITVLPGTYDTEDKGIKAGEAHCRSHGWNPLDHGKPKKSHFKSLF